MHVCVWGWHVHVWGRHVHVWGRHVCVWGVGMCVCVGRHVCMCGVGMCMCGVVGGRRCPDSCMLSVHSLTTRVRLWLFVCQGGGGRSWQRVSAARPWFEGRAGGRFAGAALRPAAVSVIQRLSRCAQTWQVHIFWVQRVVEQGGRARVSTCVCKETVERKPCLDAGHDGSVCSPHVCVMSVAHACARSWWMGTRFDATDSSLVRSTIYQHKTLEHLTPVGETADNTICAADIPVFGVVCMPVAWTSTCR